jgi:hypothetical protein
MDTPREYCKHNDGGIKEGEVEGDEREIDEREKREGGRPVLTRWEMRRSEEEMEGEEGRRRFDSQYEDFTGGDPRQEVKSAADFLSFSLVAADEPLRYPDRRQI